MRESVTEEPPPATQPIETKVEGMKLFICIDKMCLLRKYARSGNGSFLPTTHQWSNSLLHLQMAYEQVCIPLSSIF